MATQDAHRTQVIKEIIELDDKEYIPIEDYLFMLDNPHPLFTPNKFIELANAYEVLSNEKKRRRYDQTGLTGDEQYEGMDDEEDFDGFGGFNSFDEAWSAFGDMGEKPADVQPDVTDSFTSWLLFSILN